MHPPVLDTWALTNYTDYGPRPVESSPNHAGIDYGPKSGIRVKVFAPFTGTVTRIIRGRKHGDTSTINSLRPGVTGNGLLDTDDGDGKNNYTTALMGHFDVLDDIKVGDRVTEGQHIGWTDLSGNTNGHHVHFELHRGQSARDWTHFDPEPIMRAAGAAPGQHFTEEDDMNAEQDKRLEDVESGVSWIKSRIGGSYTGKSMTDYMRASMANQAAMSAALKALAEANGADPDAIAAIVEAAVADAMRELTITIE